MMLASDPALTWPAVALSLLLAFLLGTGIAVVYVRTHEGLSYSRTFVQALVLGAIISATLMLAIGNNVARGIGIVGTLALIRFRSTMKDPRDMMFVFASMAIGVASGVRAHAVALAGALVFSAAALLLRFSLFGARQQFDGLVRVQLPAAPGVDEPLKDVLRRHCRHWVLVALREVDQGRQLEHNYHVRLTKPDSQTDFVKELELVPQARGVIFFLQQATVDL